MMFCYPLMLHMQYYFPLIRLALRNEWSAVLRLSHHPSPLPRAQTAQYSIRRCGLRPQYRQSLPLQSASNLAVLLVRNGCSCYEYTVVKPLFGP